MNHFNKISQEPLTMGNHKITKGLVVISTASALYDDVSGWSKLRIAIEEVLNRDSITLAQLEDAYNRRKNDGTCKNNEDNANIVENCLDWRES